MINFALSLFLLGIIAQASKSAGNEIPFDNPALDMFQRFQKLAPSANPQQVRMMIVEAFGLYGIHVPTPQSLDFMQSVQRPIIEIGSANGYLAHQLTLHGMNVAAVDDMPMAQSRKWNTAIAHANGHAPRTSKLFHPVVQMDAVTYLQKHNWGEGKALLLMNHIDPTFLWLNYELDWDSLKNDAIIVSFSSEQFLKDFHQVMKSRSKNAWVMANSTDILKYYDADGYGTPGKTQRLETWVRKAPRKIERDEL